MLMSSNLSNEWITYTADLMLEELSSQRCLSLERRSPRSASYHDDSRKTPERITLPSVCRSTCRHEKKTINSVPISIKENVNERTWRQKPSCASVNRPFVSNGVLALNPPGVLQYTSAYICHDSSADLQFQFGVSFIQV